MVIRGEGDAGSRGGPSGIYFINLSLKPHEFFLRRDDDIVYELPVNFVQAALGDEVEVPSLAGKTKIKIPAGSQTGKLFRLKGQGIAHLNKGGRGCRGIATTDPELLEMVSVEWCTQRLVNLYSAWRNVLVEILYGLGLDSVAALRGRTDLLKHLDYEDE